MENNNESGNITADDLQALKLLDLQKTTQLVVILSDLLSYLSTIESIALIHSKYNDVESERLPNPDIPAVESAYLAIFTKLVITEIGFTRFNELLEKSLNGEFDFSLQPDMDLNISNILGVLGYLYGLRGILGIYERDLSQPIFGL